MTILIICHLQFYRSLSTQIKDVVWKSEEDMNDAIPKWRGLETEDLHLAFYLIFVSYIPGSLSRLLVTKPSTVEMQGFFGAHSFFFLTFSCFICGSNMWKSYIHFVVFQMRKKNFQINWARVLTGILILKTQFLWCEIRYVNNMYRSVSFVRYGNAL